MEQHHGPRRRRPHPVERREVARRVSDAALVVPHEAHPLLGRPADSLGVPASVLHPGTLRVWRAHKSQQWSSPFEIVQDRHQVDPGGLHAPGDEPVAVGEQVLGEGGDARDLVLAFARWSGDGDAVALDNDPSPWATSCRKARGAMPGVRGWESRARARSGTHRCSGPPSGPQGPSLEGKGRDDSQAGRGDAAR